MLSLIILVTVVAMLGTIAAALRKQTVEAIRTAPRGEAAPVGGAVAPVANVFGGLHEKATRGSVMRTILAMDAEKGVTAVLNGNVCSMENAIGPDSPCGCSAPIGTSCGSQPPIRIWWRADQIQATLLGVGQEYNVDLRGVPAKMAGRYAHVVGIRFIHSARFTAGATNTALPGYQVLGSTFGNVFLQDNSGWNYAAALSSRDLWDDRWFRCLRLSSSVDTLPSDIATNAGAGAHDVEVDLYWPLTRPYARGMEAVQDSVLLAALQAAGASALRFTIGSATPLGAPAGLTFNGITPGTTSEVWVELLYLDRPIVSRPWQVENYTDENLSGNARRNDRACEYLSVIAYPEDNGGQYLNDFGIATFQVAGATIAGGLTLTQQNTRTVAMLADDPGITGPAPTLISGGANRFILITGPTASREAMAKGQISYDWTTRTRSFTRFLQRTIACHSEQRNVATAGPNAQVVGITPSGKALKTPHAQMDYVVVAKQ